MELSLSSVPDDVSEVSDNDGVEPRRRYSRVNNEKSYSDSSLLMQVQKHQQKATASGSSTPTMPVCEDLLG